MKFPIILVLTFFGACGTSSIADYTPIAVRCKGAPSASDGGM
jgi:hypothetical protein